MSQSLRTGWDAELGWFVETPRALGPVEIMKLIAYIKRAQAPRIAAMPAMSDRRAQAEIALASLSAATLKQRIIAKPFQDRVLFSE